MTSATDKQISEIEQKLKYLLLELPPTPTFERVKLYIHRMTSGRLLSEYIHDAAIPLKERLIVAESLTEILIGKQYDRLPEVAAATVEESKSDTGDSPDTPAPDELRAMIRQEARAALADALEAVARVLRSTNQP